MYLVVVDASIVFFLFCFLTVVTLLACPTAPPRRQYEDALGVFLMGVVLSLIDLNIELFAAAYVY